MRAAIVTQFIMYLLPMCLCDETNKTLLPVANNDTLISNRCGNHPWLTGSDCHCAHSLDGVIHCYPSGDVFIMSQYYMSIDHNYSGEEIVGRCLYTFLKFNDPNMTNIGLYYKAPSDIHELEDALCGRLNRRGLLCSKCKDGFGYPMYPNVGKCVDCPPNLYARNWMLYFFISFGPLTLFLMLVVFLRINAASPPLNAFVFISQIITHPPFTRGLLMLSMNHFFQREQKCL